MSSKLFKPDKILKLACKPLKKTILKLRISKVTRIYQADQMACVVDEGWLDELLNRRTDEEIIYNEYDSIYYNYEVCSDRVFNMAEMNPEAYLNTEISESDLQSYVNKVECAEAMLTDYDQLASEGVTYGNDPEAFVEGLAEFGVKPKALIQRMDWMSLILKKMKTL